MRLKKTWFHYIMLILYIMFAGVIYAVVLRSFLDRIGYASTIVFAISMLAFLLLPFLLFQLFHFLFLKAKIYRPDKELSYTVIEVGVVIILLIFVNAERLYGTLEYNVNFIGDLSCFNAAIVQKDQVISLLQYDSSHFYSFVLSILFLFLGNNQFVGVLFNIFIQILAFAVWYFAVRTLLGRFVATSTIVLLTVYPVFSNSVNYADPANFMLLLFGIALLIAFQFYKKIWENPTHIVRGLFRMILLGLFIGAFVYSDLVFLSVVLMLFLLILYLYQIQKNIFVIILNELLFFIGCGTSFLSLIYLESMQTNTFYYDILLSKLYSLEKWSRFTIPNLYSGTDMTYLLILVTCSLFYVWGFFKNKKDNVVFLTLPAIVSCYFQLVVAKKGALNYQLIFISCLCIFVSVGLERMTRKEKAVEQLSTQEYPEFLLYEENEAEAGTKVQNLNQKNTRNISKQEILKEQEPLKEQEILKEQVTLKEADAIQTYSKGNQEKKKIIFNIGNRQKQQREKSEENNSKNGKGKESISIEEVPMTEVMERPVNYIENPLPLPKKHVKREMNYSFEPGEDFMDYDITELAEGDDFDLLN